MRCDFAFRGRQILRLLSAVVLLCLCSSCVDDGLMRRVDEANDKAYHFHYISIDSTLYYAQKALDMAEGYDDGRMEAANNIAFVDIVKMNYRQAEERLRGILQGTDNQVELLVANTQMMRLCQRESRNKEFYEFYWHAQKNLEHVSSSASSLTQRQQHRVLYAKTEISIILSAYLYYVGQINASVEALAEIDENSEIQKDTAQMLNYFYNVGSGSFLQKGTPEEIAQKEFEYLVRCYFLARRSKQVSWEANALQAMSEHLQNASMRSALIEANTLSMRALNPDDVADSLLAENMAMRSVQLFSDYGDTYQTAAALRTLADCSFLLGDVYYAIDCLNEALDRDTLIKQSPSMISAINEKLSINYSAINDKPLSDYYRNCYLDMHDMTRQDRELEARADQAGRTSLIMNVLIAIVCLGICMEVVYLFVLSRKRRRDEKNHTVESLLQPLNQWKERKVLETEAVSDRYEEIQEEQMTQELLLERNVRTNIEQRAKMSLVNSITPFIDRMLGEMKCLLTRSESDDVRASRYAYILELTDKINEYNSVLTDWIQLRKGELSVHIGSFRLQELFDIVKNGRMSFQMKNIELDVHDTDAVVKADKTLTLFMINTIADNARKATQNGGTVSITATQTDDYVEIGISDTGVGMDDEQLANVFNHQPSATRQHGFGLMNCKGIIEKYRKMSSVFSVCSISAESRVGEGTTFRFRLPRGVVRLLVLAFSLFGMTLSADAEVDIQKKVRMFADSTYFSNMQNNYENALRYADSTCAYMNKCYKKQRPDGTLRAVVVGDAADNAAELKWLADSLKLDYDAVIDMRNEVAIAALALHKWDVYTYNNKLYSRLFRENSSDPNLMNYVLEMQRSGEVKRVSVFLLLLILVSMFPAYYLLYYRHKVYYRFLVNRLNIINKVLLSGEPEKDKLQQIREIWDSNRLYVSNRLDAEKLVSVVDQIGKALEESINVTDEQQRRIELAEDELSRLKYEIDNLHINNNVLDNCFSTLKHETMYYPSRIRQLVMEDNPDTESLYELTTYYKSLFMLLSLQAQRQVEGRLKLNEQLSRFLVEALRKLADDKSLKLRLRSDDDVYAVYVAEMPRLRLTADQTVQLFTPQTVNIGCMVIRQIAREVGEITNHRACGVMAEQRADGGTDVVLTLSKKLKIKQII